MSKSPVVIEGEFVEVLPSPGVRVNGPPRPIVVIAEAELSPPVGAAAVLPPHLVAVVELVREVGGHVRAAHSFLAELGIVAPVPRARRRKPRRGA